MENLPEKSEYIKISGEVIHGQKEGRKLGFPTANVKLEANQNIEEGVYAGWAAVEGKRYKSGVMYRARTDFLEAYILDFSQDLYGKKIEIELGKKIRDIINFESDDDLKVQIGKDVKKIQEL